MPQGVPVGGPLWVVVEVDWDYNDNYMYADGNGECRAAYTSEAGARQACRERDRAALLAILEPSAYEYGFDTYIEGSFGDYSSRSDAAIVPVLAGLGITMDAQRMIVVDHPGPWTETELDLILDTLDEMQFFTVQQVTLED